MANLAARLNWLEVGVSALHCMVIVLLYLFIRKREAPVWRVIQFVLAVAAMRFLLYDNPVSWGVFFNYLSPPQIDWREKDIIANNVKFYLVPDVPHPYVMVGSSQTWAIYSLFSKTHPLIEPYYMAGMAPIDFVQEYDRIKSLSPKRIVLYLSEFDLARPINLTGVALSSIPIWELPEFYRLMITVCSPAQMRAVLEDKLLADAFPEFKYQFIATGTLKFFENFVLSSGTAAPNTVTLGQASSLGVLNQANVQAQMVLLDAFIGRADTDGIPVTIIEGQYNPIAYSPKNLEIRNDFVKKELLYMEQIHKNVSIITREQTGEFFSKDYDDLYHVKPEPAAVFAQRVLEILAALDQRSPAATDIAK